MPKRLRIPIRDGFVVSDGPQLGAFRGTVDSPNYLYEKGGYRMAPGL